MHLVASVCPFVCYRSKGFVCLSVIRGACADNLADAVDQLLFVLVSVILAVGNIGFSAGMVPGICLEYIGSSWVSFISLVLSTGSNLLVAAGINYALYWFSDHFWAIVTGGFLLGKYSCEYIHIELRPIRRCAIVIYLKLQESNESLHHWKNGNWNSLSFVHVINDMIHNIINGFIFRFWLQFSVHKCTSDKYFELYYPQERSSGGSTQCIFLGRKQCIQCHL